MFLQSPDEKYKDFKTLSCSKIEELDCIFRELEHTPTGAHIIHIENKDPENLFCLSFRTLPDSSNGIPHILEHTVLCGSESFPVKDPFFAMTRRSLNTFMNAMTGSDFTCYPASSQVKKDFYNLFDIYLDAVFKAKIEKTSFLQEGFRLEFEKGEDPSTPLLFKGIVYNEMKGSLSTGESRMWVALLEELFPDLPYAYNSGGDPKEIPNLTYEQLIAFYKENYHPSRCLFFFYGDLPLQKHLDYIDEKALKGAERLPSLPPLAKQKRFKKGKHRTVPYSVQENENHEKKVMAAFGWLTCLLTEQEEVLALSVLDSILTETDASPLKQALLASELCTGAEGFLETEISEVPYVLVCKGCTKESVSEIEKIINDTLLELSLKPFSQEQIDAAIHQLELCRTEIATDHAPFGLTLFFRSALAKQHGCDPENTLKIHKLFGELREKVKDPMYLPSLLKKHFVENTHRVSITMLPDPNLEKKEKEEEDKA
jgi:presequence protease